MTTQSALTRAKLLLGVAIDAREIGKRIAQARDRKGWTQLAFALEANVSPSSVARWEAGKLPPIRELVRIAGVLGVEPEYLVETEPTNDDRFADLREQLAEVRESNEQLAGEVRELLELLRSPSAPRRAGSRSATAARRDPA